MDITNKTSFPVIAFGWHIERGYGNDVTIEPGETKLVSGPYVGDMEDEPCFIHIAGEITCHEDPDNDSGFHVSADNQLNLSADKTGFCVRHHSEDRQIEP